MSNKGKRYENEITTDLFYDTPDGVFVAPCGYSGSHALPQPDVLVVDMRQNRVHGIELKKRDPKRNKDGTYATTNVMGGNRGAVDDFQQLDAVQYQGVKTWLAVKFTRRELLIVPYVSEEQLVDAIPDCFEPKLIGSGLRLRKPQTDEWPSSQTGREDMEVIKEALDLNDL